MSPTSLFLLCMLALALPAQAATRAKPKSHAAAQTAVTPATGPAASPSTAPLPTVGSVPPLALAGAAATLAAVSAVTAPAPRAAPAVQRGAPEVQRFDLSVNNAPASQVFMQLGSGTPYNILVSPDVAGNVSITLRDTTVVEALESLRELFGYDFRIAGNRVFIYSNTVQTKLYRINYLPGRRQGASDIRVTSSSITKSDSGGSGGSGASGYSNNSGGSSTSSGATPGQRPDDSSHVRTTSDADFWGEVRLSLQALVAGKEGRNVVLNPASGVIVVKATPFELRQVDQYLKAIQVSIERQVMIEAKIIEVVLSRDAQTGINWGAFGRTLAGKLGVSVGVGAPGTVLAGTGTLSTNDGNSANAGVNLNAGALGRGFYGLALQASNFAALLNFLETQGDVSVLSSPRIATLNNQKAVLKVGTDELYVTGVSTTTTSSGSGSVSTPTLNLQPFFSGIALDVTPQIDENGTVMLHVHPSVSSVAEKTKVIDLGSLGSYKLPLATSSVNEVDSIVRVRDGQFVAIGGLMTQETHNSKTGVPGLQSLPAVGGLFRQSSDVTSKRELVVLMRPTVIRDDGTWPESAESGMNPPAARPQAPAAAPQR